jgi:hypothetical protein
MAKTHPDLALLVTPDDLAEAAAGAVPIDPDGPDPVEAAKDRKQAAKALAAAQERLEGYLNRKLLAHAASDRAPNATAWQYGGPVVYASSWPVTQITNATGAENFTPSGDGRVISLTHGHAVNVSYVAGYRGAHHGLSTLEEGESGPVRGDAPEGQVDLRDLPGLAEITALPPVLPALLADVIVELALIRLGAARSGTAGTGARTQTTGTQTTSVSGPAPDAEERALARADAYRAYSV